LYELSRYTFAIYIFHTLINYFAIDGGKEPECWAGVEAFGSCAAGSFGKFFAGFGIGFGAGGEECNLNQLFEYPIQA